MTEIHENMKEDEIDVDESVPSAELEDEVQIAEDESQGEEIEDVNDEIQETESESAQDEEVVEEEPKVDKSKQKLIERVKRQSAKLKELHEKLSQAAPRQEQAQVIAQRPKRPTMEDAGFDERKHAEMLDKYEDDLFEWKDQKRKDRAKQAEREEIAQRARNKVESYFAEDEEYQELLEEITELQEDVRLPQAALEIMQESEFTAQIDKYILKNRYELVPKLRSMSPYQAAAEIARIEAKVSQQKKQPTNKVQVSKAPRPATTVQGSTKRSPDMEMREIYPDFVIK